MPGPTPDRADAPPPRFNRQLEDAPAPESPPRLWLRWLIGGLVLIGGCLAYYRFGWEYRLPQERDLVDRDGQHIPAKLMGCSASILQYRLQSNDTNHLMAIDSLSEADQAFVRHLPATMRFSFSMSVVLTNKNGDARDVVVFGRTEKYVKLSPPGTGTTDFRPLADLSPDDQAWLRQLPVNLTFQYPVNYTLVTRNGESAEATITGRSENLIRYNSRADNIIHFAVVDDLSDAAQAFVRELPNNLTIEYPIRYSLVTADGRVIPASIMGRSEDSVEYILQQDGSRQVEPFTNFSEATQAFLRLLPTNLRELFSPECSLTLTGGQPIRVHLLGRTDSLVKFSLLANGAVQYYPISLLSETDQAYVRRMPSDLNIYFPLEYTLTAPSGENVSVRLLNRSGDRIRFMTLADGKTTEAPLSTLADIDQTVIRLMLVGLEGNPPPAAVPASRPPVSPVPDTTPKPSTIQEIAQNVLTALKTSQVYNSNQNTARPVIRSTPRSGFGSGVTAGPYVESKSSAGDSGNAWDWMTRISVHNDAARADYMTFQRLSGLQSDVKRILRDATANLQTIRTRANIATVDALISSANRASEAIDTIRDSGNSVNRTALDNLTDFMKTWESAAQ